MTTARVPLTRFDRTVLLVAVVLLLLLDMFLVFAIAGGDPGHDDILAEIDGHRDQLTYISCLLETPSEERTPAAVAACQIGQTEGN